MSSVSSDSGRSSSLSLFSVASFAPTGCSHGKDAVVFCATCSMPLCEDCLAHVGHRSHKFKTMEQACRDKLDTIAGQLEKCSGRSQSNSEQKMEKIEKDLERDFQTVRDSFTKKYRELDELLNGNKEQAITLLEAQRQGQQKHLYVLAEEGDRYKTRANHLQTLIADLGKRVSSQDNSSTCILEIQAHQISIDLIDEFYKKVTQNSKFDKSRLEALEKSIQRIVDQTGEIFPRPWQYGSLMISDSQISVSPHRSSPKVPYQTKETPFYILAKQCWKTGRHYWEVDVGHCRTWAAGVVELANGSRPPSQATLMRLGRNKRSWMLESEDGELTALHNDNLSMVKQSEQDMTRLGVYLDMTKNSGRLTFYDVGSGAVLHSFCLRFKKSLFPAFSLTRVDGQVQSLLLCNLGLRTESVSESENSANRASLSSTRPENEYDSGLDTGGSSRSSSDMSDSESSDISDSSSDSHSPRSEESSAESS
ncbi:tripartite motif-containing protein 14-like isoform X2 [Sardina pilchardus]|uniref:tripartite motif-containing protein 14-like isoform X2 n=1 Tax=Sardina pilchardus TaxID=27697 RepID=UPI002E11EDC5